jgi:hypothetical protein
MCKHCHRNAVWVRECYRPNTWGTVALSARCNAVCMCHTWTTHLSLHNLYTCTDGYMDTAFCSMCITAAPDQVTKELPMAAPEVSVQDTGQACGEILATGGQQTSP